MPKVLYTNAQGFPVFNHSHSGGKDFSCPKKYFWKRVQGWQPRDERAALQFGKCVESAIQYYHVQGMEPGSGVDEFKKLWWHYKDDTTITYTEKSGDWEDHYRMGSEMLALYEIEQPKLPIDNIQFQVNIKTELLPDTEYEGIKYTTILDMICGVDPSHPGYALLPAITEQGPRKLIIDIKTSASSYYTDPRLSALDDQLRDYAWATGIETVAFMVLVKNHSSIGVGDWVTVLRGDDAGKKYIVLDINDERLLVFPNKSLYDEYISRRESIKGKGAKEAKEVLLAEYFYKAKRFRREDVTKQRIQFLAAVISQEDMQEARNSAILEAVEIAGCSEKNYFPKKPGVRFPNNVCTTCECLGLCINDRELVKEKLIQINGDF
jgi:hypothetical protein